MNYKVLYRKYRPSNFDEVVGQNNTITLLKDSIINDKISHAYIFSGPRGTGKTSCAKIFAKAINCVNPIDGNPCGKCDNCVNFSTSNDIYEIDAASNNGVDQIREIVENIKLTPINLKYKVYIVDEVHMLSISAFNALLLTLEEPPKHAVFILATTDIEDVPITVLSRCQRLDFKKIKDEDIEKNLTEISKKENIKIEKEAIQEIASYADGGMRDALSILDQLSKTNEKISQENVLDTIGVISDHKIRQIIDAYLSNDIAKIEEFMTLLRESSVDFKSIIKKLIKEIRLRALDILNSNSNINEYEMLKTLSFDLAGLLYKVNVNVDMLTLLEFTLLPTNGKLINNTITEQENVIITENVKKDVKEKEESTTNIDNSVEIKQTNIRDTEYMDCNPLIKIRVNNCFVNANKKYLSELKNNWTDFVEKLSNKKLKGLLLDLEVVLASDEYAVIKTSFDNTLNEINSNLGLIEENFKKSTDLAYKFIAISDQLWTEKTEEYKTNIKNNKKYTIIKEPDNIADSGILSDVFTSSKIEVQ